MYSSSAIFSRNQRIDIACDRKSPVVLSKKDLIQRMSNYLPGTDKYNEIQRALNSPMTIYKDEETCERFSLITVGLLGGGQPFTTEANPVELKLKNGKLRLCLVERQLEVTLWLNNRSEAVATQCVYFNGNLVNSSNCKELFHSLRTMNPSLLEASYDNHSQSINVSSRPNVALIECSSESQNAIALRYSLVESLDEEYVVCALTSDEEAESALAGFVSKYERLLVDTEWEEERIDLMIRRATLDGLKIAFLPSNAWAQLSKLSASVIEQFESIEQEIKHLNLSLNTKECLDFHMYRGLVFSKFPAHRYPKQRNIAISDAMILISNAEKLSKQDDIQFTPAFYKKMAHAFKVFARGVDNPPISLKFISLAKHYISEHKRITGQKDPYLIELSKVLQTLAEDFKQSFIEIILPSQDTDAIGMDEQPIEDSIEQMERMDKILFRTFQELADASQIKENLRRAIGALKNLINESQDPIEIFRSNLRFLFLRNYLNYLSNSSEYKKFVSTFDQIVSEFNNQKVPNDEICKAELHGFRGCVFITYPRIEKGLYYDLAIKDFNALSGNTILHRDLRAFQYMMFGQHMLKYDPIKAVELLKRSIDLAHCPTVKSQSKATLNEFTGSFQTIRPCLQFNTGNMLKF